MESRKLNDTAALFKDKTFLTLMNSSITPKEVIKKYNQQEKQAIPITKELRQKISYTLNKQEEYKENVQPIINLEHLKDYIRQNSHSSQRFRTLDGDYVFVAESLIKEDKDDLVVVMTAKNLLSSYHEQSKLGKKILVIDGTYKLNLQGYSTGISRHKSSIPFDCPSGFQKGGF